MIVVGAVLVLFIAIIAAVPAGDDDSGSGADAEPSPPPATVTVTEASSGEPVADEAPNPDAEARAEARARARERAQAERAARLVAASEIARRMGEALSDIGDSATSVGDCGDYACIVERSVDLSSKAEGYRIELGPEIRTSQVVCIRRVGNRFLSIMRNVERFDDLVADPDAFIANAERVTGRMSALGDLAEDCTAEVAAGG